MQINVLEVSLSQNDDEKILINFPQRLFIDRFYLDISLNRIIICTEKEEISYIMVETENGGYELKKVQLL